MKRLSLEEQNKLITDNLALITFLIRKYIYLGEDEFQDIFQEGALYMTIAARKFNPELGVKFSTFASTYVLGGIKRYKRDKQMKDHGVRFSRKVKDIVTKYEIEKNKENFSERELVDELGITLADLQKCIVSFSFLDKEVQTEKSTTTLGDTIGKNEFNYREVEAEIDYNLLLDKLKLKLNEKHYDILEEIIYSYMIGGEKLRQTEIGLRYNLCQAQVSRIIKELRKVIKETLKEEGNYMIID